MKRVLLCFDEHQHVITAVKARIEYIENTEFRSLVERMDFFYELGALRTALVALEGFMPSKPEVLQ